MGSTAKKSQNQKTSNLKEISVPGGDVVRPLLLVLVILRWGRVILQKYSFSKNSENASLSHLVVRGPGDDLLQNVGIHIRQGDNFLVLCVNIQFHTIYKNRLHRRPCQDPPAWS